MFHMGFGFLDIKWTYLWGTGPTTWRL